MKTNFKEIVTRAKNIIIVPKDEWNIIVNENKTSTEVLLGYMIWLILIPVFAVLIGWNDHLSYGIKLAVQQVVSIIAGCYLMAWILNELAEKYGAAKNFDRAFGLIAYCYTADCISGIFMMIPALKFLSVLGSLYSFYLLYTGIRPMMNVPEEKVNNYYIISLLCMIGISLLVSAIYNFIIF